MKGNVLISGVSTGIGAASARELLNQGYRVFGSVRKVEDADGLALIGGENFIPLVFDVVDKASMEQALAPYHELLSKEGLKALVNNAGMAVGGPLQHLDLDEIRYQFEVNVFGMLALSQVCLPYLGAIKNPPFPPGKIIQISSVSGKLTIPFAGPYVASKHAMEGFSGSLRQELQLYGIEVVILGPGVVKTAIWDKLPDANDFPHAETDYGPAIRKFREFTSKQAPKGLASEVLGQKVRKVIEKRRNKIRYAIVPNYWTDWFLPQYVLSTRFLDKFMGKLMGLKK